MIEYVTLTALELGSDTEVLDKVTIYLLKSAPPVGMIEQNDATLLTFPHGEAIYVAETPGEVIRTYLGNTGELQ